MNRKEHDWWPLINRARISKLFVFSPFFPSSVSTIPCAPLCCVTLRYIIFTNGFAFIYESEKMWIWLMILSQPGKNKQTVHILSPFSLSPRQYNIICSRMLCYMRYVTCMNRFSFVCNCGFDARQATSVWRSVELTRSTQTEVALTWDDVERRLRTDSYHYLSYLFAERDFAPVISFALI